MLAGLVNQYRVLTTIGAGGMGVVYKAIDTRLNRPVAIKAIRESEDLTSEAVLRLRAEALAAASLDHPYICKIYELLDTDSGTLIVMEYIEGETLASVLRRGVPPLVDTLRYGSEIAEGLADAHGHGLIHRDVKPSNVMITAHGHVKLLDFGVVRVNAPGSGATTTHSALTKPGGAPGTPLYMAPEQALGLAITSRADIFSLGIILFECLTGHLPFDGGTRDAYVHAMLTGRKRRIEDLAPAVPGHVRDLIDACLQGEPSRRPESASVVAGELRRAADGMSGAPPQYVPRRSRWRRIVRGIATAAALAALAAAAILLWRSSRTSDVRGFSIAPAVTAAGANVDPRISPDGRWLSFLSDRDGPLKLFVQAMEAGKPSTVEVPGAALVTHTWSPDGREFACVVRQQRDVFLEVVPAFFGGLPRITVPLVPTPEIARAVRWLGHVVFIDANLGREGKHLWRVDLDSQRIDDLSAAWERMNYQSFDVSPDGRAVVFAARRDNEDDLWVVNVDGSGLRRLTNDALSEREPLWMGNTGAVVFQSSRSGPLDLWQIDTRSGSVAQITSSQTSELPRDSAADGSVIAFEQVDEGATLWLLDARSRQARQLTADALSDAWPTVGSGAIAFQRTRPQLREGYQFLDSRVLVARIAGDRVTDPIPVADGFGARLSPDGTSVAYLQRTGDSRDALLQVRSLETGATRTVTQSAMLPGMSFLFPVDWIEQKVVWGPAGRRLYFVDHAEGKQRIAVADLVAGSTTSLVVAGERDQLSDIRVSADGSRIAYLEWTHGEFQIHIRDVQSGRDEIVRTEPGPVFAVFLRGWSDTDRSLYFLRTERNADGTDRIDVFETGKPGAAPFRVGSIDNALMATTRLSPAGRDLYVTRVEAGVHNVFSMALPGGQLRRVTDNQQRGVSFTGIVPLADGGIVYSRPQIRRDVYLARRNAR